MLKNILDKKILCPFEECNNDIRVKLSEDKAKCDKCNKEFFYIQCYYCVQLIFFKKETNTNGFNIRCPYKGCGMVICRVKCPKCKKFLVHRDTYYQGEISSCSDCGTSFTVLTCPFKPCCNIINLKPSYTLGNNLVCNHDKDKEMKCFQKISCMKCYRHVYFDNNQKINDKNNCYIPTQLVRCPYDNCKAKTQQVECNKCSSRWFVDDHKWSFGRLFVCKNDTCNNEFSYSMCPECLKVQTHQECCMECKLIHCVNCDNKYQFTNCRMCHEVIFWSEKKNKKYQNLQLIKCPNCETLFQTIKCSECNHLSTFFAKSMKLSVPHCCKSCNKNKLTTYWSMYFCSECGTFNMKKVKASSSSKNKNQLIVEIEGDSSCSGCKKNNTFINTQCPHCLYVHTVISSKKTKTLSYMSKVQCQNQICKKYFYYYKCTCGLDYTRETIQNPFKCAVCSESISEYYCTICKRKSVNMQNRCDRCHNPKTISSPEPNEELKLQFVEFQQGDAHSFGIPEKDYGEIQISENLIQTKIYSNKPNQLIYENETHIANIVDSLSFSCDNTRYSSKKIDLNDEIKEKCVICLQKEKQSVFAPCGHRCVCFECGKEYIKNKNNIEAPKCPICKEIIFDFLEKVDDSLNFTGLYNTY